MDSSQLEEEEEEQQAAVGRLEDVEVEVEEAGEEMQTAGSIGHPSSIYENHYQQMHPLIYYGDEFGYQQLSQIMSGKVDDHQQQHQHQVVVASPHWSPVKQEGFSGGQAEAATVLHFGPTPSNGHPHNSICRLELDFDQQHLDQPKPEAPELANQTPLKQNESLTNDTTLTLPNNNHHHHHQIQPTPSNRELHNEIERRRRSRIKHCCEVLRILVPGLNDKTDKATVLEQTVKFMNHLVNCPNFRCNCEIQIEERKL